MAHKIMRLVVLYLIPLGSYAQTNKTFNIGDSMPLITFSNVYNQHHAPLSPQDYKGKLVIIDFWSHWCGSCIEAFPKMEKLQKEFGDKIKVLLVTPDKKEDVIKLFKRFKIPELTILYADTLLSSMFPHIIVPHHVWVNPDGRIQFITDGYNATAQNISKVLEGKSIKLQLKTELTDVDVDADLWQEGNGRFHKYISNYSFVMSKVKENWHGGGFSFLRDTNNRTCSFRFVNVPLLDFYRVAFGGSIDFMVKDFARNNRIQVIGAAAHEFLDFPVETDSIPSWEERNLISYESKWKIQNDSLAYQYLRDDANRFFPFSVKVETKEATCYILKKASNFSGTKSASKEKVFEYTDSFYTQRNMPIVYFVESLGSSELLKNLPVVDETNYNGNIDLHLKNAFTDISTLKKQLLQQGLLLEEGNREMRILVISIK